jgi:hypothetical protein
VTLSPTRRTWLALLGLALGCDARAVPANEADVRAEFGIFYGGQIQHRRELPLELDRTRQLQGFRLRRSPALETGLTVRWVLGKPGAGRLQKDRRGRKAAPRGAQLGEAQWRAGEAVFEQTFPFAPGDPPGLWNLRVQCGDQVVLDQSFLVFDPVRRAQLAPRDGDAG